MTHTRNSKVAPGYVGEFRLFDVIAACKLTPVSFDSLHLIQVAQRSPAGMERISMARPYLKSEYGTPVRKQDGKFDLQLKWEQIPPSVILDRIYGLDAVVNFRGWNIGIDVTTNPETLIQKRHKLNYLASLWKDIGIDCIAVVHLLLPQKQSADLKQTSSSLTAELRQVIKQQKQIFTLAL